MLEDDHTAGQTYELFGPTNYSMHEIGLLVDREIIKKRRHINVPKRIAQPLADILNKVLWWHTSTADEIEREFIDQEIDKEAKTFKDLGIEPAELKGLTFHYLVSYCLVVEVIYGSCLLTSNFSKITGLHRTTICRRQASERRGKRKSTCMSLMISDTSFLERIEANVDSVTPSGGF